MKNNPHKPIIIWLLAGCFLIYAMVVIGGIIIAGLQNQKLARGLALGCSFVTFAVTLAASASSAWTMSGLPPMGSKHGGVNSVSGQRLLESRSASSSTSRVFGIVPGLY